MMKLVNYPSVFLMIHRTIDETATGASVEQTTDNFNVRSQQISFRRWRLICRDWKASWHEVMNKVGKGVF
jgi:hypothetical protein